ncbi:1-(5-phosphoribosyl)-5-[(5-phosphoribosylamino)methylideneamino]imidazole-4-carboxamide isomerase [Aliifodinibius salipaludis]|uniref:1-(5-phosphoribosyl)-5-[(5-phosphoribosylamino)methylideneamino] imidazole-4-carboxamide isomerase n=1 Tax=Fodinibius salipaludis TaxID=2032627 RepID=A0A2A2G9Y2_9BACT|nr:1-(5-phosphoribosyl)-5-[(5-phosphoribosylamino)methylideneamino]imidazole-4-carboxamide isomerase [Aliifodinibius salipaludis]PAU93673.1 1-(5-phosphoribosyl)-5-[(5-phosphoribosylamino)methylideneamino]imidazole-4-carboxamide isomerase [Aliifodinibius salipaludis]
MIVIPAIDLLDGNVVRLHKGDYDEATIYNHNPVEEAQKFKEAGFNHIHIVDLNGAKEGKFVNLKHVKQIIDSLDISVQTGGGIRSFEDAQMLLDQGLSNIICSSMAVKSPGEWLKVLDKYGDRAILGMDLKNGKVAYGGWLETLDKSLEDFLAPMIDRGLSTVLCTDTSKDGTLEGPNVNLYKELSEQFPDLNFIASGGVSDADDLKTLQDQNQYGVVVGRAYYEEKISLEEMLTYHSG